MTRKTIKIIVKIKLTANSQAPFKENSMPQKAETEIDNSESTESGKKLNG